MLIINVMRVRHGHWCVLVTTNSYTIVGLPLSDEFHEELLDIGIYYDFKELIFEQ